ncbi:hypothetical protein SAMN05428970_2033 [Agromyces sp. CF514]|uniref:hypothetical protein n=1 Tax=Agromyces sp. CF514 TaxID=1881031 RepID=UPI0008F35839|nr:hypothetical protein [Agromyces sp. CF514]SFR76232.1 hypothetical protein SAMN05428970_2033 [Agromyces sp. CF514]
MSTSVAERTVIAEIIHRYPEPDQVIYHLREGYSVNEFQPVKCGGGINMHGSPTKVPVSDVCPDCLSGRRTM